ncbi:histidine phosphatase family protein [Facklamia miroungae]|uniref:Probable phosphoglycerate mutase n=1 Tax=Facklamia miroungae TaxID=120956 RepID=A0A1G7PTK9_9LACT|nr:histidine phosphatase family protein [Facklamia miroungae]NKZ28823.1 histidine phosphatase family protein [Facklamia miroungae]SDF89574.1 probable phosphoglycerate mutase [Facklamia miroungae]
MAKGVTFYFMRHGETLFNHNGQIQGWSDAPLTPKGIEQAKASGRGIADIHFNAVYSSDLLRTQDTLRYVLEENHHKDHYQVQLMKELREVYFGSFEGLPASTLYDAVDDHLLAAGIDVKKMEKPLEMPKLLKLVKHLDPQHLAENYAEFWDRIESGLLILLNKHAGTDQKILIMSHGMAIGNLIHGLVADFEGGQPLANCSLSIVEYREGQFRLNSFNQTDHFIE